MKYKLQVEKSQQKVEADNLHRFKVSILLI